MTKLQRITITITPTRALIAAAIYRGWLYDGRELPKRARGQIISQVKGAIRMIGLTDLYRYLEDATPKDADLARELAAQQFPEVQ